MHSWRVFLGVLFAVLSYAQDTRKCYWPNGQEVNKTTDVFHYTPCFEGNSQCCASGEVCMTNGLCFGGSLGQVYRGSCTDKEWKTNACPQYCNSIFKDGWANLIPCPMNANGQWRWWCGRWEDTALCNDGPNSTFLDYPQGKIAKIISANASDTNSSTSNPGANCSLGQGVSGVRTGNDTQCKDDGSASPLAIGLGLGIPLFLLAASLAGLLWRERRRHQQYMAATQGGQSAWQHNGGGMQQHQQQAAYPVELHGNDKPVELGQNKSPIVER